MPPPACDARTQDKCPPAKVKWFPKRPRQSTPKYCPRTEYQDAYKAYSPDTIRRIYQENRKAMMKNRARNTEESKESVKDLLPAVGPRVLAPVKPRLLPTKIVPCQKHNHKHKVPSPKPLPAAPTSSKSNSNVSSPAASPSQSPKPMSYPGRWMPPLHWCSNITCHYAPR